MIGRVVFSVGLALVAAQPAIADLGPVPVPTPPLPSVPAPSVPSVPSLPSVPALPAPSLPATPAVPHQVPTRVPAVPKLIPRPATPQSSSGSSSSSAPGAGRTPSSASGPRTAPSTSAGSGRAVRSSSVASGSGSSGGRSAAGRAQARGRAAARSSGSPAQRRVARERRLRRTVRRLGTCLDDLPTLERRVLELRTGLGPGRARNREGVARALDLSTRRVTRLERRGVRRLRAACGTPSPPTASSAPSTATPVAAGPGFFRAVFRAAAMVQGDDRVEVKAEHESSADTGGGERASGTGAAELAPAAAAEPPVAALSRDGGSNLAIPLLVLIALVAIGLPALGALATRRD
jgi:Sigma-70, region 4